MVRFREFKITSSNYHILFNILNGEIKAITWFIFNDFRESHKRYCRTFLKITNWVAFKPLNLIAKWVDVLILEFNF